MRRLRGCRERTRDGRAFTNGRAPQHRPRLEAIAGPRPTVKAVRTVSTASHGTTGTGLTRKQMAVPLTPWTQGNGWSRGTTSTSVGCGRRPVRADSACRCPTPAHHVMARPPALTGQPRHPSVIPPYQRAFTSAALGRTPPLAASCFSPLGVPGQRRDASGPAHLPIRRQQSQPQSHPSQHLPQQSQQSQQLPQSPQLSQQSHLWHQPSRFSPSQGSLYSPLQQTWHVQKSADHTAQPASSPRRLPCLGGSGGAPGGITGGGPKAPWCS